MRSTRADSGPLFPTVDVDEDTSMLTIMSSEPADAADAADGATKLQMIMELDMDIWRVSRFISVSDLAGRGRSRPKPGQSLVSDRSCSSVGRASTSIRTRLSSTRSRSASGSRIERCRKTPCLVDKFSLVWSVASSFLMGLDSFTPLFSARPILLPF